MNDKSQTKSKILATLFSKHRLGIKPGLERTLRLANSVGNPHNSYNTIHIAGTNGKGSVCSVVSSILQESGLKVGLYTSPHIKDFNERIRINGDSINDNELIEYAEKLLPYSEEIDATFFEITTVMAFLYFADRGVDVAVIETGMGGRFDSTNIILPKISVITDIDMDHEEFLGDTIEKITFEKAGIIKPRVPIITTNEEVLVLEVIREKAENEVAELILSKYIEIEPSVSQLIDSKYISLSFKKNYRASILACERYLNAEISNILQIKAIKNLSRNSGYFARLQILQENPTCLLDISHSVAAIQNLVASVKAKFGNKKWIIIITLMNDKDYKAIINILAEITEQMILTQVDNERSMLATDLYAYSTSIGINSYIIANPKDAKQSAIESKKDTIITGSFYLAAEVI